MDNVRDRIVQYANRYKLTNADTGEVLGTFDFDEVTGTVTAEGTPINKALFDSIAADLTANAAAISAVDEKADTHIERTDNPHTVTKAQVGLGNVANERQYSASNPPPYPVTSVAGKTGAVTLAKNDVGLGNVDNTSDTDKPVSTATQTALNGKANTSGSYPNLTVGKATNADNAANAEKLGNKAANEYAFADDLIAHETNISNPHSVSKEQVGLGNVDNIKQYSSQNPPPYPVTSVAGKTGAVTLTKTDVGLGNVANERQYSASNPPPYPVVADGSYPNMTVGNATKLNGKTANEYALKSDIKPRIYSTEKSVYPYKWEPKTWNEVFLSDGGLTWTDGNDIYYSGDRYYQYVLNRETSTWEEKTWNGTTSFYGSYTWTDGENIYCSNDANHYVLNRETSTWEPKTWNGLALFSGSYIWTDGENIYFSHNTDQYVLNRETSTWERKTWNGLTSFDRYYIWTDGNDIYYSEDTGNHYVLNRETSTWEPKTWQGLTRFHGNNLWTDGENIYCSIGTDQYVLNRETSTWERKTWNGLTSFYGRYIWTDGENIYCSRDGSHHKLTKAPPTTKTTLRR